MGEAHKKRRLPKKIGRYEILCPLGEGGMAAVYLGRTEGHGGFQRLAAIKVIHEHLSHQENFMKMFLDEARIAARIRHPNIVPVYDIGEENGSYFIAMDYVNGETLQLMLNRLWRTKEHVPVPIAAYTFMSAAEALHAAHELRGKDGVLLGTVHRDVSPQNIMIGFDGIPRVLDFGVAKATDQLSHTRPGSQKGTPAYMAPEHITGEGIDRRADIFSLGVVMWETTLGRRLFKGVNDYATARRVVETSVPPPSDFVARFPPALETIILRALDKDPSSRYQTARELADDLGEFLAGWGERVSAATVEDWMKETFADRYKRRLDLERKAQKPVAPANLRAPSQAGTLPPGVVDAIQMPSAATVEVIRDTKGRPTPLPTYVTDQRPPPAEAELVSGDDGGLVAAFMDDSGPANTAASASIHANLFATAQRRRNTLIAGAVFTALLFVGILVVVGDDGAPSGVDRAVDRAVAIDGPRALGESAAVPSAAVRKGAAAGEPVRKRAAAPKQEVAARKVILDFELSPKDAVVLVDGEPHSGPLLLEQSETEHTVEVRRPGYRPHKTTVRATESRSVEITLEKLPTRKRQKRKKRSRRRLISGDDL